MSRYEDPLAKRLAAALPIEADEPGLYRAAVALVLVPDPSALLVIRRAHREGDPWSGHMALPGGRSERDDPDLIATAVREAREEVGIVLDRDQLLGALDDVAPRSVFPPPVAVRPYVFRLPERPALVLNSEVDAAEWVELDLLARPDTYQKVTIEIGGQARLFPAFVTPHGVIWGMTERILSSFLAHLQHA